MSVRSFRSVRGTAESGALSARKPVSNLRMTIAYLAVGGGAGPSRRCSLPRRRTRRPPPTRSAFASARPRSRSRRARAGRRSPSSAARPSRVLGAQVRYITSGDGHDPDTNAPFRCGATVCTATSDDFTSVKGELDFPPRTDERELHRSGRRPRREHRPEDVPGYRCSARRRSAWARPQQGGADDPQQRPRSLARSANPLGAPGRTGAPATPSPARSFFVDPAERGGERRALNPALDVIAREPGTARFGKFSFGSNGVPNIETAVSRYLARARRRGAGQRAAAGDLPDPARLLRPRLDSPADAASYHNFIEGFAQGIGSYRAVLFLEMDSIITMPCLSRHGQAVREHELQRRDQRAHRRLPAPRHLPRRRRRRRALTRATRRGSCEPRASPRSRASSSTPRTSTGPRTRSATGSKISALTGGKHFVVNTGENGRGPLRPRDIVTPGTRCCATRPAAASAR